MIIIKVTVVPNYNKPETEAIVKNLTDALIQYNIEYDIANNSDGIINSDIVIAVGGDGTILHTAKRCAEMGISVLGVNAGRIGYLADLSPNDFSLLKCLSGGEYSVENRMMLEVSISGKTYYCLNDAVIGKGSLSRMIDISMSLNGSKNKISYRADGLIVSTPTGSTAYSMSAGGPVVDPKLNLIVVTPICSNSLFDRPLLLDDNSSLEFSVNSPENTEVYLTLDGEISVLITHDATVKIKKSTLYARLVKLTDTSFYEVLSKKFRGNNSEK